MPRIIILVFIGICGFYAYKFYADGGLNWVTKEVKTVTVPTEIPKEYQGRYISDLVANINEIKYSHLPQRAKEQLYYTAGKWTIKIDPSSLSIGKEVFQLKPVDVAKDHMTVEMPASSSKEPHFIDLALNPVGVWVTFSGTEKGHQGLRQLFRRLN